MTRKIILIRHAKSAWDSPSLDDHDRPLNDRGRRTAPLIGRWLAERGHVAPLVLCSDARRTAETAQLVLAEWPQKPELRFSGALYHAAPQTMLEMLQKTTGDVAMIGHNPGIAMLAEGLVETLPDHPRFQDYPTCATTVLSFENDCAPGRGRVLDFVIPADLG